MTKVGGIAGLEGVRSSEEATEEVLDPMAPSGARGVSLLKRLLRPREELLEGRSWGRPALRGVGMDVAVGCSVTVLKESRADGLSFVSEDLRVESRTELGENRSLPESLGPREIGGRARVRDDRSVSVILIFMEYKKHCGLSDMMKYGDM